MFEENIFSLKFEEFNKEYEKLEECVKNCNSDDLNQIRHGIIEIEHEYKKNDLMLQTQIDGSRSPAAAELASAQLDYNRRIMNTLNKDLLDSEESAGLYVEYAMDLASQAMRHALLALLCAKEAQLKDKDKEK